MNSKPNIWKPHNYQIKAVSFLLTNPRSGLFLDPGLGKTSTSLWAIRTLKDVGQIKGVLMVAPLRVCYSVWPSEIKKWDNFNRLTCTVLHDKTRDTLWGKQKDIYLINPEGLPWLFKELLTGLKAGKKSPFNTLWIDESTKFKNALGKRFELLCSMLPLFKRRHIMTGTPSPKSLLDLWSQIYILDEGKTLNPNFYKFRSEHFEADDWNKYNWEIKDFQEDIIHKKVSPIVLEMSAKDYLTLPDISYNEIEVELPTKAYKYYKEMEKEMFIEIDSLEASAEAQAQASMKCHQIANGQVYEDIPEDLTEEEERRFRKTRKTLFVHDEKAKVLQELIDELNGKPVLIAYNFKHDLEALRKLLGSDLPFIGSGVTPKQSKQLEDDWNAGKLPYLACQPESMSHGLNLQQSGNDIFWYSIPWNLETYIQFNKRIHRQGVKGKVRVHHAIAKGTVDKAIMKRLGERASQQLDLREAIKQYRMEINP